ncbi:MAG: acyl-CoA thioesterase [Bacteroidetes bacterium]|nr:acyl-CoA thioesterase [Bacteroidota bacterium]
MYKCTIKVRGYELDSYGHVNNSVFFNYFEQARWEVFENAGLLDQITTLGLFLVVTEANIRYQHEVRLGDEVEISTLVKKDEPFIVFDQRMRLVNGGISVAKAKIKTVFVDGMRISHDIPPGIGPLFNV